MGKKGARGEAEPGEARRHTRIRDAGTDRAGRGGDAREDRDKQGY